MDVEVWISPKGEEAALNYLGSDPEWYADQAGQRPPAAYAMTNEAARDVFTFTVYPVEPWSAYDAASDRLTEEGWTLRDVPEYRECVHGMSADLCAGPGHYPMDY